MSSAVSSDALDPQWTVRVQGPAASEGQSLVVHGRNLMPLVARLLADARVQDIVVRPRIREVRAHVSGPASARAREER
jgi:hypothetical protein